MPTITSKVTADPAFSHLRATTVARGKSLLRVGPGFRFPLLKLYFFNFFKFLTTFLHFAFPF